MAQKLRNILRTNDITTCDELVNCPEDRLLRIAGMDTEGLAQIRASLQPFTISRALLR